MNSGNAKTPPADGAKSSGPSCAKDPSHARGAAPGLVSFVGAGPGDPELLTIKGRKAIEEASLVLYAGSLVPPDVVACAAPGVPVVDSAPLTLEQCHDLVRRTALAGGPVARVHTGDPSLYGALREQARLLDQDGIPWRVIPGVTAACAAAAAAGVTGLGGGRETRDSVGPRLRKLVSRGMTRPGMGGDEDNINVAILQ